MVGAVTGWDILSHAVSTIRCFGWRVFFRAIAPRQTRPLLGLLQEDGSCATACSNTSATIERCVGLELREKRIYEALANAFFYEESTSAFYAGLALQEQHHADLLQLCRAAAVRGGGTADPFKPWQDCIPRLERQLDAVAAAVPEVFTVDVAFRLVVQIESSEINEIFQTAVAASDASFVKKLRPFQQAMEAHRKYIWSGIMDRSRSRRPRQYQTREGFLGCGVDGDSIAALLQEIAPQL